MMGENLWIGDYFIHKRTGKKYAVISSDENIPPSFLIVQEEVNEDGEEISA